MRALAPPLVLLALAVPTARAEKSVYLTSLSMAGLIQSCNVPPNQPLATTFCTGYIMGVADALSIAGEVCVPASDSATLQINALVRKHFNDHPESWHVHPVGLVREALVEKFPCKGPR